MNKGDLTNEYDNKAHARKGKGLEEFSAKNIFPSLQNIYFSLTVFALYHLRWNDVAHQAAQPKYEW